MNGALFVPLSVLPTVEPLARVAAGRGLDVVLRAGGPVGAVSAADRAFLRPW